MVTKSFTFFVKIHIRLILKKKKKSCLFAGEKRTLRLLNELDFFLYKRWKKDIYWTDELQSDSIKLPFYCIVNHDYALWSKAYIFRSAA